jgi:epoxyqueuosine reductase
MNASGRSILTARIREEAQKLGLFKIGITPAGELPYQDYYNAWLQNGYQGGMHYLNRQAEKRRNPGLILPNTRTLIVAALNYYFDQPLIHPPLIGKISRYALGEDYHKVVKKRLERLLNFIQIQVPTAQGRCFSDTGPVMEKAWGAESSLGWMGKHTILITREMGSWFFLGVILLDIALDYDRREKDFCGDCTRCMQACPTQAIVAPHLLDARLCLSYQTIESQRIIPRSLRAHLGNRIYGCDICQEACPWNRFAANSTVEDLKPRSANLLPDLISLSCISAEAFDAIYENSPIRRLSRDGFVRNVVVALGNSGKIESVAALGRAIRDESDLVRAHAAWALGQLPFPSARRILEHAQVEERSGSVSEEIAIALKAAGRGISGVPDNA